MNKLWILAALIVPASASAQSYTFTNGQNGVITEKTHHEFLLRDYAQPIAVPYEENMRELKMTSPEKVAVLHFNAMLKGDYGLWMSLWDDKSKTKLMADHAQTGRDVNFWKKWWRKGFVDFDHFHLTRRVDFENYTIIEMTAFSNSSKKEITLDVPIKRVGPNLYAATEDLREHPIFQNWRQLKSTVEKTTK